MSAVSDESEQADDSAVLDNGVGALTEDSTKEQIMNAITVENYATFWTLANKWANEPEVHVMGTTGANSNVT